jgi:hypothetical protein
MHTWLRVFAAGGLAGGAPNCAKAGPAPTAKRQAAALNSRSDFAIIVPDRGAEAQSRFANIDGSAAMVTKV